MSDTIVTLSRLDMVDYDERCNIVKQTERSRK
jgi:hypothetical protein